jgi:soluble lytic murein transglycosylase-like protein
MMGLLLLILRREMNVMVKGKYKIRKHSLAWYVTNYYKPIMLLMLMTSILLAFAIVTETYNKAYAAEQAREPHTLSTREMTEPVIETETKYWDVPLSAELQAHIVDTCSEYRIPPELVIAIIKRESNFNSDAIGDSGASLGLMQIQPRWHSKRMEKLGCTDLLNPFENVAVGIDIIAEKVNKYDTLGEALTVYNAGDNGAYQYYFSKGIYANDYALDVIENMKAFMA